MLLTQEQTQIYYNEKLTDNLEDLFLCEEAQRRLELGIKTTIPAEQLYAEAGITQQELDEAEDVDIE